MKHNRRIRRKARGARFITTVSVVLVLTVLGLVALTGLVAGSVTQTLRSGIGIVVIVNEESAPEAKQALEKHLKTMPEASAVEYTSAEKINQMMIKELGDEELAELNPFQGEYAVKVKAQWSSPDKLKALAAKLKSNPAVYDVKVQTEMASNVNRTVNAVTVVLLVMAGVLLVISFVLMFNTVAMEVYAQRAVIHTMQYVGARMGFILRPYIIRSVATGVIAGVVSSGLLCVLIAWVVTSYPVVTANLGWEPVAIVFASLTAIGTMVCGLATWIAASRYVRRSFDKIYER